MKKKYPDKIIGYVGVDSGQVMICDPCYIESEWMKEKFEDYRPYDVTFHGAVSRVDMGTMLQNGINYETPLKQYENMTMNELLREGMAKEVMVPPTGVFSYNGACKATNSKDLGGQLNYRMGHPGVAVAVRTGFGDGHYPVTVTYDQKTGRVRKVTVNFFA
jgi:hypothetical protein